MSRRMGAALLAAGLTVELAAACVGSEGGRVAKQEAMESATPRRGGSARRIDFDTVAAAPYQVFDTRVESERPRKLTLRLVVLTPLSDVTITRTLEQVLDSIAKADTTLAAARAILYTGRPAGPRQMDLQSTAYALWVPPEGWDSARAGGGRELHRTYIYRGRPPWSAPPASGAGEGGTHD